MWPPGAAPALIPPQERWIQGLLAFHVFLLLVVILFRRLPYVHAAVFFGCSERPGPARAPASAASAVCGCALPFLACLCHLTRSVVSASTCLYLYLAGFSSVR